MAKYLDDEDEKLEKQQTQQQAKPASDKKAWNIDYTKFVIPEGVKVENAKITRIPPKEGEKWAKYVISADIDGTHYEQEMWNNDRKAYYEKDPGGNYTHRVTIYQLVAKYFGKHFPTSATVNTEQVPQPQEPGILAKLWVWLKGLRAAHQEQPQSEDDVQEPKQYTNLEDVDGRIAAVRTMADLQRTIENYENVINTNKGIVTNVRNMYAEKKEYIGKVANISESADHRPLQAINANVDKALVNVARNLYDMPLVRKYIEQLPKPAAPMPEQKEKNQEVAQQGKVEEKKPEPKQKPDSQEQPKELQAVLGKMQRESVYTKIAAVIMAVITLAAVWQCSSARNQWMDAGKEKGRKEIAAVANARIDSLQTVIARQRQEVSGARAFVYSSRNKNNAKAEVTEFFRQYDNYRHMEAKVKRLENENKQLEKVNQEWKMIYGRLRKTANDYATAHNKMAKQLESVKPKAKVVELPEIPEAEPKSVFHTIRSKSSVI